MPVPPTPDVAAARTSAARGAAEPGSALRGALSRFRRMRAGTSAVEFALVLPVMLVLWAGMSELAHAVDNWRKLTLLARTISDLTAQGDVQNPISTTLMNDILAAAASVMRPFDSTSIKIVVSALGVDLTNANLKPRVCSSIANGNATPRSVAVASDLTVPTGYQTTGVRYILTEVSMTYTPMIGAALVRLVPSLKGQINLAVSMPWPERGGKIYGPNTYTEVVLPGGAPCS